MADPNPETAFVRDMAQLAGRDGSGFVARRSQGSVHVQGPFGAARYPLKGWRELFLKHLHAGWYDCCRPCSRIRPAAACRGLAGRRPGG